jgi:hypothetical protein
MWCPAAAGLCTIHFHVGGKSLESKAVVAEAQTEVARFSIQFSFIFQEISSRLMSAYLPLANAS